MSLSQGVSPKIRSPQREVIVGDSGNVNQSMAKQIKVGKYPVDIRLDLHGKTQIEAHQALVLMIEQAYHLEKRCVLVITGKGRLSEGGGVLRKQLPFWLNQRNLQPYVLMVNEARPCDGGSGAFYVILRKKQ